jgi:hypothetical protein
MFNVVACGRRFGKTHFVNCELAVQTMLDEAGPFGYFAPTYKLLSESYRDIVRLLKPIIRSANATDKRIELITGGTWEGWTLEDEDAGRSRKYRRIAVDEAGLSKKLGAVWENAIYPTLSDYEGEAWFLGTPKGMNFFHQAFQMGRDPLEKEWASFHAPTSANPYIRATVIERARRQMTDRAFRQEYEAEFLEDAGGVFQGVRECIGSHPQGGAVSFFGLDLARTQDYTVLSGLSDTGIQRHMSRWNGVQWEATVERVGRVVEAHPGAVLVVDSSGVGDPVFELIRKRLPSHRCVSFKFTSESKRQLIENLQLQFERRDITILDDPVQTGELLAYEYDVTAKGTVTMNAPDGMHDDTVIALALAAWEFRPKQTGWATNLDFLKTLVNR